MKKPFKLTPPHSTEAELHAAVAHLLDWLLLWPAVYTTFPAGGYLLSRAAAGQLKRRGLKPGMPDILLFHDRRTIGIELKAEGGILSKRQKEMFYKLRDAGVAVYFCRSQEDVITALQSEKFPLRRMSVQRIPARAKFHQQQEATSP